MLKVVLAAVRMEVLEVFADQDNLFFPAEE
jgi:hypothetical protein